MTDEDAFLTAIEAAPQDRLRQLVFADWLDERNRPLEAAIRRAVLVSNKQPSPGAPLVVTADLGPLPDKPADEGIKFVPLAPAAVNGVQGLLLNLRYLGFNLWGDYHVGGKGITWTVRASGMYPEADWTSRQFGVWRPRE